MITVCDSCLRASCWQRDWTCNNYLTAGSVEKSAEELKKLSLENPDYWKNSGDKT